MKKYSFKKMISNCPPNFICTKYTSTVHVGCVCGKGYLVRYTYTVSSNYLLMNGSEVILVFFMLFCIY